MHLERASATALPFSVAIVARLRSGLMLSGRASKVRSARWGPAVGMPGGEIHVANAGRLHDERSDRLNPDPRLRWVEPAEGRAIRSRGRGDGTSAQYLTASRSSARGEENRERLTAPRSGPTSGERHMSLKRRIRGWRQTNLPVLGLKLAAALLLPGCTRKEVGPFVEFAIVHTDPVGGFMGTPGGLPPEPTVAEGRTGSIRVRGIIALPDRCDDVGADLDAVGSELTLRVGVRGSSAHLGACGPADRVVMAQYEATVGRLRPGSYRLHIAYDYRRLRAKEQRTMDTLRSPSDRWQDHDAGEHLVKVQ